MDGIERGDLAVAAARARTVADLAELLRALRRREAERRQGPELSYRQLADRTGWSRGSVFGYLTGLTLAPASRLNELVRLFGARPDEAAAIESAHSRVAAARQAADTARSLARDIVAPRTLPAPARAFTGRAADLAALDALLSVDADAGTVLISAVAGMGGVGKTALAVYWAHRTAGRFPDGQLYVNLRGYDPAEPLSTMDALGVMLAGLGVPPSALPSALPQRTALYRRLLAGRTALILLDNASGVEQVRPLLPPPPCLAVVTSRDDLAELVASDGARRVTLDVLPEDDARGLLRLLIGERADREPFAVLTLARLCGYLPLALRVAAEHANARPLVSLTELAAEFGGAADDQADRTGDERTDVGAVFSWSVRHLPAEVGPVFPLLGLVPGTDIDVYGLAALAGVDLAAAGHIARTLSRAHLLQADGTDRYSMHDLLRAYAADTADRTVAEHERLAAVTRLLDYYRTTAAMAIRTAGHEPPLIEKHHQRLRAWSGPMPDLAEPERASAWLAAERVNLVRSCLHAARHGWPAHAVALALDLQTFLDNGYDQDALAVHTAALAATEGTGEACDPRDVASLTLGMAAAHRRVGALDACRSLAERTLAECTRLGDASGAVRSLFNIGAVHDWQGRFDDAYGCFVRALDLARSADLPALEGRMLICLGSLHGRRELYETAADYNRQASVVLTQVGDTLSAAEARNGAAYCLAALGRYDEAAHMAEEALAIHMDHAPPRQRGMAIIIYGGILRQMGRYTDAVEVLSGAVALGRDTDSLVVTVQALNALGEALRPAGDHHRAIDCHIEAGELAERSGDLLEVACAEEGLGDAYHAAGQDDRARVHWTRAGQIYADMGHPAAARIEQYLQPSP